MMPISIILRVIGWSQLYQFLSLGDYLVELLSDSILIALSRKLDLSYFDIDLCFAHVSPPFMLSCTE
jgi:hypothetical protein